MYICEVQFLITSFSLNTPGNIGVFGSLTVLDIIITENRHKKLK